MLKEATVSNDTEGTRYYSYDGNYNLIQIKNNVKTITFSYYPADKFNYSMLKSITLQKGSETKRLEIEYEGDIYEDLEELSVIKLTVNEQAMVIPCSLYEEDWNYLKLDFGSYYELVLRGSGGVKAIQKYTPAKEFLKSESYRFTYYDPAYISVDYGYGRSSDKTWMLYYLDKEEFFKIPFTYYAVDTMEDFEDNGFFRQHSHQYDGSLLKKTKVHKQEDVYYEISYKFDKLEGKSN